MKRNLFLLLAILIACSSAIAQINHPFVEEGKVWYYEGSNYGAENYKVWEEIYSLEGDTLIGSHQCLKLYLTCNGPYKSYDHAYMGAMYEKNRKVYYIVPGNTTSTLLYDFTCEVGSIIKMYLYDIYRPSIVKWDEYELIINDKQLVKYRDEYLTVMNWSPLYDDEVVDFCTIWIEGVGSPTDLLNSTPEWYDGGISKGLRTCKLNDQIIYDKHEFMEYYPEPEKRCFTTGTKWTEIRLDTLKYDNWYSKVGDDWVPNYETVEYSVKLKSAGYEGKISDYVLIYDVYTNGPEWSDSLFFELYEFHTEDDICIKALSHLSLAQAYQFNWFVGKELYYQNIVPFISSAKYPYGTIEEIQEGDFGGVRPLKYVDLNGVRIIQGIGVTEWNDGECLFGPVNLYRYSSSQGTPPERHYRSMLVHFERDGEVLYDVWPEKKALEEPVTLPFLEGNPIWEYKYEHISMPRDPNLKCWVDTGNRNFTYYFLGGQKEIEGKVYTMMGRVKSNGENNITFRCWLPVREENGVVYTLTDSLLEVCKHENRPYSRDALPYLQQGDECVLYNFCAEIGEKLCPKDGNSTVESIDTYQLMDGTVCRVLKPTWGYSLCEKLGYLDFDLPLGMMAPYISMIVPTNGHVYCHQLNAYYQDEKMLYKVPDAQEGLCVNDTCWTREAAGAYASSYRADPYQEKVFSFIRQLQMATGIVEIKNGILKMNHEGTLYDLQGRRLSGKPARGIYIENGKKKVK